MSSATTTTSTTTEGPAEAINATTPAPEDSPAVKPKRKRKAGEKKAERTARLKKEKQDRLHNATLAPEEEEVKPIVTSKKVKKQENHEQTLANYEKRIKELFKKEDFKDLDGVYLSDFNLVGPKAPPSHHASILSKLAEVAGFKVKGLTNENTTTDKASGTKRFVTALPDEEKRVEEGGSAKVIYIGGANALLKKEASKYAKIKADVVYLAVDSA